MTYDEACEAIVSYEEARAEIEGHCLDMDDFTEDHGVRAEYQGSTVLEWLGY